MKNFNRKKAWYELAAPAFMALPVDILQVVGLVMNDARGIRQNSDLSLDWPADSFLEERMNKIPLDELARASRIVWATGHWHPGSQNWLRPLMRTDAYWKFSAYADQVLRQKCEVTHTKGEGINFEIHEGFIRACVDFDRVWEWHEVALATPENLRMLHNMNPFPHLKGDSEDMWNGIYAAVEEMKMLRPLPYEFKAVPCHEFVEEPIAHFFDLSEYYDG